MSDQNSPSPVPLTPLQPDDPPKIGDFWLDARMLARVSGVAFTGHTDDNVGVIIILLSQGAAADAAARDRLAGTVNQLHIDTVVARGGQGQGEGRLAGKFRDEDDDPVEPDDTPLAPWVAIHNDGSEAAALEAERILASVDQGRLAQQGTPAGPGYRPYWMDDTRPGFSRVWPLPWPGRHDRGGWLSIVISWLLVLLLAALALLIIILLFQKAPPQPPPPPVPTSQPSGSPPPSSSPSPQSGSPSPQSGSPSPQSGSPSPQSGSPSQSGSGSPSPQSGSPTPSETSGGSPTPNSKL